MTSDNLSELLRKSKEKMTSEHSDLIKAVEDDLKSFQKSLLSKV